MSRLAGIPRLAATLLLVASLLALLLPASAQAEIFHDDFNGPAIDASKWALDMGGGSAQFIDGRLVFSASCGAQFPNITTLANPFPETGDFSLSVGFRYVDVQAGGNGLYAPNGFTYGGAVHGFQLWQDYCCANGIMVVVGEVQVHLTPPPDTNYHTYAWRYIAETYYFYFDGSFVTSSASSFRPTGILVGHPPRTFCPWTTQSVDFIHIESIGVTATARQTWSNLKQIYR